MGHLEALRPLLAGAVHEAIAPTFKACLFARKLARHLDAFIDFGLREPEWFPVGLPLAIAQAHLPASRGLMDIVAGAICWYCSLDAIDDVQDGDLGKWDGWTVPEIINAGVALQSAAAAAFRRAGCRAGFQACLTGLALDSAAGQALDLGSSFERLGSVTESDYCEVLRLKTGSTFEIIAGATCDILALPEDRTAQYVRWARELGIYLQAYSDAANAKAEVSDDLAAGKMSYPILHFFWNASGQECQEMVERLKSYRSDGGARRAVFEMLRESGSFDYSDAVLRDLGSRLAVDLAAFVPVESQAPFRALILENDPDVSKARVNHGPSRQGPSPGVVRRRIAEGIAALESTPDWPESWEIHRWGFAGADLVVGDVFPGALILAALQECGSGLPESSKRLLWRRAAHGWAYFPDLAQMPPDADTLGQILQVMSPPGSVPGASDPIEESIGLLLACIEPDGRIPTWLGDSPASLAEADRRWHGNDCVAAMASAYTGLLVYDPVRFGAVILRGLEYLGRRFEAEGDWSTFWYIPAYSRCAASGLFVMARERLELPSEIDAIAGNALDRTWQAVLTEESRGGEDAPLGTALDLATICLFGERGPATGRMVARLVDSQGADGLWPSEGLYRTAARDRGFAWYGSKSVTTAFCVRALWQYLNAGDLAPP